VLEAPGHQFTDKAEKYVSVINLASVRALEKSWNQSLDPLRFRANVYIDGLVPWAELDWVNKEIGIGSARLAVFARTTRCAATNVDPETGARDTAIPAALLRTWGHQDFGVYAKVTAGGAIASGTPVAAPDGR
jgi:uncharacterized protein YcbX